MLYIMLSFLQSLLPLPITRPQIKEQLLRQPVSSVPATTLPKKDYDERGYDNDFVKPPPESLRCKICTLPARDPVQTNKCCGQTFCRKCANNYQSPTAACPKCGQHNIEFVNDKRAEKEIGDLKVYCTHKIMGCSWVGELRSIQQHLNLGANTSISCQYIEVSCSNGCGVVMRRELLKEHLRSECELRQITCEYCGCIDAYQWISDGHQQECPKYPMECPNHCEVGRVTREEMSVHLKECPLAVVKCPFAAVGCDSVVRRDEMTKHIELTTIQHTEYMMRGISSTITQIQSIRELIEQRTQQLQVDFGNSNLTNQTDLKIVEYNVSGTMNDIDKAKKELAKHDERLKILLVEAQSLRQRAINVELKLKDHQPVLDNIKHQFTVKAEQLELELQKVYEVTYERQQDVKLSVEEVKKYVRTEVDYFKDKLAETKKSVYGELSVAREDFNKLTTEKTLVDNLNSQLQESKKELGKYKDEIDTLKQKLETEAQKSKDISKATQEQLSRTNQELQHSQDRFEKLIKLHVWDLQLRFLHATSSHVLPDVFLKMTDYPKYKSSKEVWYSPPFYTEDEGYKMCVSVSFNHTAGFVSICVLLMCGEYDNHLHWPIKGTLKLQLMNQKYNEDHTPPVEIVFDGSDDNACCQRVMVGDRTRFGNYFGKFINQKFLVADVKRKTQYLKEDSLYFKLLTFVTHT